VLSLFYNLQIVSVHMIIIPSLLKILLLLLLLACKLNDSKTKEVGRRNEKQHRTAEMRQLIIIIFYYSWDSLKCTSLIFMNIPKMPSFKKIMLMVALLTFMHFFWVRQNTSYNKNKHEHFRPTSLLIYNEYLFCIYFIIFMSSSSCKCVMKVLRS